MTEFRAPDRPAIAALGAAWSAVFALLLAFHALTGLPAPGQAEGDLRLVRAAAAMPLAAQFRDGGSQAHVAQRLAKPPAPAGHGGDSSALAGSVAALDLPILAETGREAVRYVAWPPGRAAAGYRARAPPMAG